TGPSTPLGTSTLTVTGVSGSLTHTTTVTLVVRPPPHFTLSASPSSGTVSPGASTTYSFTSSANVGITGTVTLSMRGLPTDGSGLSSPATGTLKPNPPSLPDALPITTGPSTPLGTSTLTVTGVSGSLTHTTTVALTVAARAPVTFDNKVESGFDWNLTTITTPSFIIGSGPNREAMIMVAMSSNNATGITARLGGVSGTLIPGTDSGTTAFILTLILLVI